MNDSIVTIRTTNNNRPIQYDYYIAVDWSQNNMAIATSSQKSKQIHTLDIRKSL